MQCKGSTTGLYSRKKYRPCGKEEVVAVVKLYGVPLTKGDRDGTPMCQECLDRAQKTWENLEVKML